MLCSNLMKDFVGRRHTRVTADVLLAEYVLRHQYTIIESCAKPLRHIRPVSTVDTATETVSSIICPHWIIATVGRMELQRVHKNAPKYNGVVFKILIKHQ